MQKVFSENIEKTITVLCFWLKKIINFSFSLKITIRVNHNYQTLLKYRSGRRALTWIGYPPHFYFQKKYCLCWNFHDFHNSLVLFHIFWKKGQNFWLKIGKSLTPHPSCTHHCMWRVLVVRFFFHLNKGSLSTHTHTHIHTHAIYGHTVFGSPCVRKMCVVLFTRFHNGQAK